MNTAPSGIGELGVELRSFDGVFTINLLRSCWSKGMWRPEVVGGDILGEDEDIESGSLWRMLLFRMEECFLSGEEG